MQTLLLLLLLLLNMQNKAYTIQFSNQTTSNSQPVP